MTRLSSPTLTELQIASLDSMGSIPIFSKFAQIRIPKRQVEVVFLSKDVVKQLSKTNQHLHKAGDVPPGLVVGNEEEVEELLDVLHLPRLLHV